MAVRGTVVSGPNGFAISHGGVTPTAFPFATQAEASAEAKRIFIKSQMIEQSCGGGGVRIITDDDDTTAVPDPTAAPDGPSQYDLAIAALLAENPQELTDASATTDEAAQKEEVEAAEAEARKIYVLAQKQRNNKKETPAPEAVPASSATAETATT